MRIKAIRFLFVNVTLLVLLGVFARVAYGQVATGQLTGTVTDAKGAAMAGVNVVLHNVDTGADMTPVKTNDSGVYTMSLLPPGNYDVTATQAGFATVQHKGVTVQVGQTVRIDVEMPVASQQSLVTVTTEAPVLETEKTEQSQNVSESLVSNLPVSSRRWEQFVMLTPGVTPDGTSGQISFHGINSLYSTNSVDGANNNSSYNGNARGGTADGYVYSGDSIREFQVSGSNFTAEIGQSAGGAVNAVTKSGTNNLHGDLFYNIRNPIFNAIDPVGKTNAAVNHLAATQPVHQQNQFGGSVGGPILKDKLFGFATYDGYWRVFPNTVTTQQASPAIGSSTFACPSITFITAAQCAAAKNYALTQIIGSFPQFLRQDVEFAKIDYQFTQANHFSAVANIRDWKNPKGGNGNATLGSVGSFLQDRFVIATWSTVITNNKVNEVRYQWGADNAFTPTENLGGAPRVALSNLFTYGSMNGSTYTDEYRNQISDNFSLTKGSHTFKMGGDINFLFDLTRSAQNSSGQYAYSSAVALPAAVGCGAAAAGGSADTIFCDWIVDFYGVDVGDGKLRQHWTKFTQQADSRGFPTGSVSVAPGFGAPDGRTFSSNPSTYSENFNMADYAGYFQDTWKARPNLTLNLGIRYDFESFQNPPYPNLLTPLLTEFTATFPNDYNSIQPRVGIAWNFTKKTVLRAGGGIFVAKTPGTLFKAFTVGGFEAQLNCNPGTSCNTVAGQNFVFPNVLFAQQDTRPSAPFTDPTLGGVNGNQPLTPAVVNPTTDICPCGNRGNDPTGKRPRAYEAQVAIEHQLPGNMSLTVTYVMTRGVHLPATHDENIAPTTNTKSYDVVNAAGVTQIVSTVPFYGSTPPGGTVQGRLDSLSGPIIAQFTGVNSWYHGIVVTLHKPMSHGVEILANYTVSKATDDGQAGAAIGGETFFSTDGVVNPFNQRGEQGYSSTDARNRFTTSIVWQPSYGKNFSNKIARGLASGWNLSTTLTASNGTRYSGGVQSTGSQTICAVATTPCPALSVITALQGGMSGVDIDTTAASIGGRIAWVNRNQFQLPNYANVDVRLARQFTFHERYAFEFRAEAFNLLNSTIVQAVSTSAYTFGAPAASTLTNPTPACWNGTTSSGTGPAAGTMPHINTCMTPVTSFQSPTTTTANLLGARQLQFGFRFNF